MADLERRLFFFYEIVLIDFCFLSGDNKLILSTENGTFIVEGNVAATSKKKMRNDFVEINFNSYRILNYNLIILGGFFFQRA